MKVKEIICAGGACPYQCEGFLEDGREFYIRYRWGRLTLRVGKNQKELWSNEGVIYTEKIGEHLDGAANNDLFHEKLDNLIQFPSNFIFEYPYDKQETNQNN